MKNNFWNQKGCDECRTDAVSGQRKVLKKLAVGDFLFLHQCVTCGTYWEENPREMHPITLEEVKSHFPEYTIG
jgi:hypothetical protein